MLHSKVQRALVWILIATIVAMSIIACVPDQSTPPEMTVPPKPENHYPTKGAQHTKTPPATATAKTTSTPTPTGTPTSPPVATSKPGLARRPWTSVQSWAYWLDNPDLQKIQATNYELVVIDYSADGSATNAFSAKQIQALRTSGCQRRVVAYLSIGQAESYRGYWQQNWKQGTPSWLEAADPEWNQNYWVRYWEPGWQNIILRYLDAIIAAGFDGIYLDRIDAYQEDYAGGRENEMVQFVKTITQYARSHSPLGADFGVIAQNADDLAPNHLDYVKMLTGIGREETYVEATNKATSLKARNTVEQHLDLFRRYSQGKLVLTVDYANQAQLIQSAYTRARTKGYVPYVTTVDLDRLQNNAGFEPGCRPL